MESITLGQNSVSVTPLCLGTWAWGDKLFWNYGNGYGSEQVEQAFNAAIEAGITFFDTAEVYGLGLSEELLGKFMKNTDKEVQIATKFGPLPWRFSAESVSEALTESLKRLQVQQIALYQVHWPFTFFMSQETLMNALATEVEKGRIKTIGVSNYSQSQMQEAHQILARRGIPLAVNQVRYSLLTRQVESQGIIATAKRLGVKILAYSPLAQGLLTGKYSLDSNINPTGARSIDPRFNKDNLQKIEPVISLLRNIGEKYSRTPAQVALNWLIAQGNVIPISGVKTAEQVQQNAGAVDWKLSDDEVTRLNEISRPWLN
ncbi:putative oxidoreductase, aryl-alcohol dehydrogenase like protein [Rivularia sp. PCC 7116]|uniref:aldo/keto reductase n=1 Tax=Rivularia sp. PCC 7116 TaxID=373994 RepID=UPI00029F4B88|nr:aldo/keto reductase [Rivularia sp. PCC 7116]AFY58245.1 putative oxidoreductase, aryl-alcohol dehydrogenase like protein [Rivularia sp. PCC 7116]